ncbi:hypothetical protein PIB30_059495 [Stylosanthes scabra]|uniref:SANT domain-containing protein n=1 Tax=Stylosanthes scabra TaxID=79078 RepID=A0ABU6VIG3_9FABA|nr:hypothetical protein [Stylosanthes scabra]
MKALCFDDDNNEGTETKSYLDNKHRDKKAAPRVGDQYQVEIPSLIAEPRISQSMKISRDSDKPEAVSLKLRIPLTRPHCKLKSSFETLECVTAPGGSRLLPGLLSAPSWTDIERNSFLLGLYAFGKNLNTVKRFVGSKSMGDILSFYYGKFHRSEGYCRWSKSRKWRSNRRIYGQKIFIGWRQQELLSRLSSNVSKECQTMVVELTKKFAEGKMRFQDYLFSLKDAVGIEQLVAAVGVGKGKKDLTISKKTQQIKHNNSDKPKMQKVKTCSCVPSTDIAKLLKGDFKLSKARSNNLFWEDVWPRLVAKGWHSEQPKDRAVSGSKQYSVFLIPGIKKFSRAKLQKGNHYFDSISDVLKKVASDPRLLEMETQAKEKSVAKKKLKQEKKGLDGHSKKNQICHPRTHSSKRQDPMKLTIVDTSIVLDSDKHKGRKLRISSFRTLSMSTISSHSSGSDQGETENQAEQASSSNPVEESSDKIESPDCTNNNNYEEREPSKEINKYRFVKNVISDCSKYLRPVKKPKLTTGNHGEFSDCTVSTSADKKLDSNESSSQSYHCGESKSVPDMINEGSDIENYLVPGEETKTKTKTKMLLDLNLPLIEPELEVEIEVPSSMIIQQNNDNQCENAPCFPSEVTQINETEEFSDGHEEQKPIIVNRRQSTRNRPLTRKALEALECRFVNSKRKRKSLESSQNNSKSQGDDESIDNAMPYLGGAEKENVIKEYSSSINLHNEDNDFDL